MSQYEHTVYAIGDLDDEDDESAGFDGEAWDDFEPGDDYPGMGEHVSDNEGGDSAPTGGDPNGGGGNPFEPHVLEIPIPMPAKPAPTAGGESGGGGQALDPVHEVPRTPAKTGPAPLAKKSFPWGPVLFGVTVIGATVGVGYWMHSRKKGR